MDYNYPLDYTWSTEDIIDVMSLYNAVEKAYEEGISKADFLNAYRKFKNVVGTKVKKNKLIKNFKIFLDILFIKYLKQVKKTIGLNYND